MKLKEILRNTYLHFPCFFIFLFLYFLFVFDLSIYYHFHQPIFLFDKTYLQEFLLHPGGLIEWMTQFFLQFLYFNLLGSILISALIASIFSIVYRLIEKTGHSKYALVLSFLPVSLLLIIQNHYNFPLIITVKYLFTLFLFLIYTKIANRYKIVAIFLSGLIYVILGGWAYLFYIILCIVHELLFSKEPVKYIYAGLNAVVYLVYPYIAARYLFMITLKEAYLYIVPREFYYEPFKFRHTLCLYLFFLSLPVLLKVIFIYTRYIKLKIVNHKFLSILRHVLSQSIFIILVGGLILKFSFDREEKKKIQIDYLAEQGQWQKLLNLAPEIDNYDRLVNFNVNRALYHTGQLLDNLFGYTQLVGTDGLFIDKIIASQIAIPASDLYFELGHINASQVMAYEAQTKFKYHPRILKRLAQTNIINEKYIVAKKFLDLLNKSILHKKWVKHYKSYLQDESLIESDSLIQLKQLQQPKSDFFIDRERPNVDLIKLLVEDKNNKMAFEYLMAYYLLDCRLANLTRHLDKSKIFGYKKFPRHIEEALLLIKVIFPSKININEYNINPQTIERFKHFSTVLYQHLENDVKAKEHLEEEFHNTYWYYVRYVSPKKTSIKLKARKIDEDIF